jgi:hypothetical protein
LGSEKQRKEDILALRSSPNNSGVIKWRRMGWVGYVEEKCLQEFGVEIQRIMAN